MGRMRNREPVHFGIDYFKAYIEKDQFKKSPLFWLSPNSHEIGYDDNTRVLLHAMKGGDAGIEKYFEIRDIPTGETLAFILLSSGDTVGSVARNNQYEVTGVGLILRSIQFYYDLLDWTGFFIKGFRRVDICIDIHVETDYMIRNILLPGLEKRNEIAKKKALEEGKEARCRKLKTYVGNKGEYETLEIGEKRKSNTWLFIRVYNKWLDTTKRKKWGLYDETKVTKDTTRIEVEIREDKCLGIHDYDLLDTELIFGLFKRSVFGINYQFFSHIHEDQCKLLIESHIMDVFDSKRDWNPSKGLRQAQIAERLARQETLGTSFLKVSDKDRAVSSFKNLYKKLRVNGFSRDDLANMLYNVEEKTIEEHKKRHKIQDFS